METVSHREKEIGKMKNDCESHLGIDSVTGMGHENSH